MFQGEKPLRTIFFRDTGFGVLSIHKNFTPRLPKACVVSSLEIFDHSSGLE
jgi:hypothetical protein